MALVRRVPALAVGTLLAAVVLGGCGAVVPGTARVGLVPSSDRVLIDSYVASANHAGDAGPAAQAAFLRATQAEGAPFPPDRCFTDLTLQTDLVGRTLRPDPGWRPPETAPGTGRPPGAVYVVAAAVSVRRGPAEIREDVGSKHFVVRGDRVTGYAPCAD
ncbi:hypothetical protein [Actinomycetospora sp. TBRC 11914]|uniref:hypothetical protein n=1 Tax=Actinomycetospora sp. TBRC 11914 TaxID=2729387 RepID=UPI00145F208F|nr:hypothetical protein [Actinomycetospora sp. TBRC 11914]NMO93695.1 hypothetical protein [Actinomycetospora sp. TBRC 11914]